MNRARLPVLVAVIGCIASITSHAGGLRIAPREASPGVSEDKPGAKAPPADVAPARPDSPDGSQGEAAVEEAEQPAWSAVGVWDAKLASDEVKITLRKDGTLSKDDGEPGRWSLAGEQGKVVLVMRWETRGTDSLEMVNGNYFRGTSPDGGIELRRAPAKAADNRGERKNARLAILSAMYGIQDQRVDVTLELQALVEDGWLGIPSNWRLGRIDPAEGEEKDVVIQYRSEDGRNRTARFREDEPIVLPKE